MMNFVLKPSLEHITLVKVVASLWNQNDVRTLILEPGNLYSSEWEAVKNIVIKKVPHLSLSEILKEKVLGLIEAIGLEIKGWIQFHCERFELFTYLPAEFCWSLQGTVDRKKTAEVLVKDANLDISTRYKLACIYCLEDDIIQFWNKMPEDIKQDMKESYEYRLPTIKFWSRKVMRSELDSADISYKDEFRLCVICDNNVGAEYFLQKLTPAEKEEELAEAAKHVNDADTLCFLLSKMDEKQQMEVFKNKPYGVLQCFLNWPWQNFFIEVANCIWDFLSKKDYAEILLDIIDKVRDGYKEYNYQKLLREFWQESPSNLKSFFINEMGESLLLQYLFDIKNKENNQRETSFKK